MFARIGLVFLLVSCSKPTELGPDKTGDDDDDAVGDDDDDDAVGDDDDDDDDDSTGSAFDLDLTAQLVGGTSGTVLVSNGVPFPEGAVTDVDLVALSDASGELSVSIASLATWRDGSVRSALVQFETDASTLPKTVTLSYGLPRSSSDRSAVPVTWTLPEAVAWPDADWMSASGVAGPQMPTGSVAWAADWEDNQREGYDDLVGDTDWGPDCRSDGYYSTTWAWYQLFVRGGDPDVFAWARREAVHYRDDQIVQSGADAGTMNGRSEPRYLYQKALETDYLLTGDPKTLEVAELMAAYALSTWDPDFFFFAADDDHFWTERRAGFALLNLVVYGRLSGDTTYLDATHARVDQLLATQDEWPDGGFIHDLYAHDPGECGVVGTKGGSPFMTGLLYEALVAYYEWFEDPDVLDAVVDANDWLWDDGWNASDEAFQYQIGCESDTGWTAVDLNLMIVNGFAFAWHHTGDQRHRDRALAVWDSGVANAYIGARKQYNQNYRSSPAALWYLDH